MVKKYLYLLTVSAFLSITVFEGFLILGVIYTLFQIFKERKLKGILTIPLGMYIFSTITSTLLFFPKIFFKSLGEGGDQIIYFLPIEKEHIRDFKEKLPYIFIIVGIVLSPILFYNIFFKNKIKLLWGGPFEVGHFYAMFSITAILLLIKALIEQKRKSVFLYFLLSFFFVGINVFSAKRSAILALIVVFFVVFFVLFKNRFISRKYLTFLILTFLLSGAFGYTYLSTKDYRFQLLNEVILGRKEISKEVINKISSSRFNIMLDGLEIIKKDIENWRIANILIGHGIRSGLYLPHKFSPPNWERYESIFVISEFIEKGIVGLSGIIFIFLLAFKKVLSFKVKTSQDILTLILFTPLLLHLVGSIFTFFWDAILPLYLLLFKVGEVEDAGSKM